MKEILTNALTTVIILMLSAVLVFGAQLFHQWCEKVKQQTQNEALKNLIEKLDYIVQLCVEATNQTFVNDKKADGTFTEEDKQNAFSQTVTSINNMITDDDKEKIIQEFGDIGTFVKNSIENYIKTSKEV